ncbi:4Fe-4S dicluster domain-containing protein [Aeromonas dhakensis]|uniref:4Fe-4S dicluster domain-containing protein n=1 Tax=Aeromonas dhakensis TaxID=196024 RepID=UPI0002EE70A2|nr:4Fe-4S dicluster domain-containing protein [Aeromonas dhakensis]BEJ49120.1 4Fe-4S dicluster domain-containing protein [Aeromonas dhakensis]HDZ8909820.1 4Fe-4S dicluster domain-containing protein [Aeromonas dhakensis]
MNRFVIADLKLCIGCGTCMAACSEVHKAQGLQQAPRLTVMRHEQATMPVQCRHCDDAPCSKVCPVEAIRQTGDSVQLNESLCIGCNLCAVACPFGAIQSGGSRPVAVATSYDTYIPSSIRSSNPSTSAGLRCFGEDLLSWEPGVRSIAVKCDLCEFRADGPACVGACPSQALKLVNDGDTERAARIRRQQAADTNPQGASAFSAPATALPASDLSTTEGVR